MPEPQSANTVLMVRPVCFGFNPETAADNFLQNKPDTLTLSEVQQKALAEFDHFVSTLRKQGIHVLVVEDTLEPSTPDSIFPNNWISFHSDGRVGLYPMLAENRRLERRPEILEFIVDNGFAVELVEDFRDAEEDFEFLEGTGSMVLDRSNKVCYAALSERTHPNLVIEFCEVFGFTPIMFTAFQMKEGQRKTIYHTNIVLSVLEHFAIIGLDSIDVEERGLLVDSLNKSGKMIIDITPKQVEMFAGNVIELQNDMGERFLIMSETALQSLTEEQRTKIETYCKIISVSIDTIENIGGGSARCMIAEVFLPKF